MFQGTTAPDHGMHGESDPPVDRYIGKGSEPFNYSVRINSPCLKSEAERTVRREVEIAKAMGRNSFEWKMFDFPPMEFLGEILSAQGFVLNRSSRLMFAPSAFTLRPQPSISVREIHSETDFDHLLEVNALAFGQRSEWLNQGLRREVLENSDRVKAFLASVDGKVAACGWIKRYSRIGFLFGGGTSPELRGRGAYKALVSARCAFARTAQVDYVASECSPQSEPILRALQFGDAGRALQWVYEC